MLLVASALAGSIEVQVGPVAVRGASRHVLTPMAGLRLQLDKKGTPWLLTGEVAAGSRAVDGEVFRHQRTSIRTAVGVGAQKESKRIGAHVWLGPALATRIVSVQRSTYGGTTAQFGMRAASGMSWFLGKRLALRFQLGTLARFDRRIDFDFDGNAAFAVRW